MKYTADVKTEDLDQRVGFQSRGLSYLYNNPQDSPVAHHKLPQVEENSSAQFEGSAGAGWAYDSMMCQRF